MGLCDAYKSVRRSFLFNVEALSSTSVCRELMCGSHHVTRFHVTTAAQTAMRRVLDTELQQIRDSGTWKTERVIVSSQGPRIRVEGRRDAVLNFCANNYLGLSVS